mgnify:CR=1 FL=1|jgi:orotidine-5'-phosphate decarboxylase
MTAERIYCAVDTTDLDAALALAELLGGEVGGLKLGKEFFTAHGPDGVAKIAGTGHKIFLDLKFHDIPNTVAGAVRAAAGLGVHMMTIHASGGAAMMRAAAEAAKTEDGIRPLILAVTVLTSLDADDLAAVGQTGLITDQVARLAALAKSAGVDGAVCSPLEISTLKASLGADFALVAPGVRPIWAASDDQKRVMTPGDAVTAGADFLVIGRPITRAGDPVAAARRIADELG